MGAMRPSDSMPRDRADADALVWALSRGKASAGLQADALADDFEGMNELTDEVSRDYAGRFLAELIQNGHDAHPVDRTDGQIDVVYEPAEGPAGTLYAANRGRPFFYDDLTSIAVLAKSTKIPGKASGTRASASSPSSWSPTTPRSIRSPATAAATSRGCASPSRDPSITSLAG